MPLLHFIENVKEPGFCQRVLHDELRPAAGLDVFAGFRNLGHGCAQALSTQGGFKTEELQRLAQAAVQKLGGPTQSA